MKKPSGPAIFMNSTIVLMALTSAICFCLYYGGKTGASSVLWIGIVAFMIVYHFWLRLILGNVSKRFTINPDSFLFREAPFEKKLYQILRVKRWKGKALTYNPEEFSLKDRSLEQIAATMRKSEIDHWMNEVISLSSILFALLWGQWWIFILTAIAAMIFDAQFIIIQRYNRPRVLRIAKRYQASENKDTTMLSK